MIRNPNCFSNKPWKAYTINSKLNSLENPTTDSSTKKASSNNKISNSSSDSNKKATIRLTTNNRYNTTIAS